METKQRHQQWERASAPAEDWRNLILDAAHEDEVLQKITGVPGTPQPLASADS